MNREGNFKPWMTIVGKTGVNLIIILRMNVLLNTKTHQWCSTTMLELFWIKSQCNGKL